MQFNDLSSGTISAYEWDFPGGTPSTSTAASPTVTYNSPGVYDVSLTVYNGTLTNTLTLFNEIEIFGQPQAGFDFFVNGRDVDFFGDLSVYADSYFWDFGDNNTSTLENPQHTYACDSLFNVTLTIENGCDVSTLTRQVLIETLPEAGFESDIQEGCQPLTVNFMQKASKNAQTFDWEFHGGTPSTSNQPNPTVSYTTPGRYDVTLTVANNVGTDVITITDYITVHGLPVADFTSAINGLDVAFTSTSEYGSTFSWNFGDGNTSNVENPTHTYATGGTFNVSLTVSNPDCGSHTITKNVTITLLPTANVTTAGNTNGCATFDVQFQDASTNSPTAWAWTFQGGNPATSTDQNPMVSYANPGSFDVTLIATNALGSDTIVLNDFVTVDDVPTAAFTSNKMAGQVSFTNTSVRADTYSWDFGDGNTSTVQSPTHTYVNEGTYTVTLVTSNACGSSTTSSTIIVVLPPVAAIGIDPMEICPGETVTFTDNSSNTIDSRSWTFEGGQSPTGSAATETITYATPGRYDVTLIVSNSEGADTLTLTDAVIVKALPQAVFTTTQQGNQIIYNYTGASTDIITWTLPDGSTSMSNPLTIVANQNGDYTVTLSVSNDCGMDSQSNTTTVAVYPVATISIGQSTGCAPFTTTFSAPDFPDATYTWSFAGGTPSTSTEQSPSVTFTERGVYGATLTITNPYGTDNATEINAVTVEDVPTSIFTTAYDGIQLTTTNSSEYADSYLWNFGDGSTSTDATPSYQYQTNGTYDVSLTSINECGEITTSETVVIELLIPTIDVTSDVTAGCAPFVVNYTNNVPDTNVMIVWTFEGGTPSTSTEDNPTVVYDNAGIFDVTVMVSNAVGSNSRVFTEYISVESDPVANFDAMANGLEYTFIDMSSANVDEYIWDFGDGNTSNEANPVHTFATAGVYSVSLTVSNECGSHTFMTEVSAMPSSIENVFFSDFSVRPNPFTDQIVVGATLAYASKVKITILDNIGREVSSFDIDGVSTFSQNIEMRDQASGLYILVIQAEDNIITKKVIKQ